MFSDGQAITTFKNTHYSGWEPVELMLQMVINASVQKIKL
jgi:hypothetical protein